MPKKNIRAIKKREDGFQVKDAMHAYLNTAHVKRLRPKTQIEYESELEVFSTWCATEHILLHQIDDQVVYRFIEHVSASHTPSRRDREAVAPSTLAGYVKVIKTFLNWCLLDEQYGESMKAIAVKRIEKPPVEKVIIQIFSPEQLDALFTACAQEESEHLQMRDRAILALLLDSGIRADELCTLTIGNVVLDPQDAHIRILGKGRKWGEVGLGEQARRAIQKYIRVFREPTIEYALREKRAHLSAREYDQLFKQELLQSRVFVNRSGKPLTISGLYRMVVRLGSWAGVQNVRCSPHTFRHTFATLFMLNNNHNVYMLSKILRHTSLKMTQDYIQTLPLSAVRKSATSVLDVFRRHL